MLKYAYGQLKYEPVVTQLTRVLATKEPPFTFTDTLDAPTNRAWKEDLYESMGKKTKGSLADPRTVP